MVYKWYESPEVTPTLWPVPEKMRVPGDLFTVCKGLSDFASVRRGRRLTVNAL